MHIGIFTDTYLPQVNGVVTSIESFKKAYEELGHQVTVFCPKVPGARQSTDDVWRFSSFVYPFQKEYRVVVPMSHRLRKIKDCHLDVIHAHTPFSMGYLALRMAKRLNIPCVHTYHTYFEKYLHYVPFLPCKLVTYWANKKSKEFCNACNAVIVPSHSMNDKLNEYNLSSPQYVIPSGIKVSDVSLESQAEFRQCYGIEEDDVVISFVGRLALEKNIYFLIDTFSNLHKMNPKVKLLIIGDGPERQKMIHKIKSLSLQDRVIMTGYLPRQDVFTALKLSKILAFPSKTETQGLCVVEALALGTPAVCINEMGVSDVLNGDCGGFLVSDNLDDYVSAMRSLIEDEIVYEEKKRSALERAKEFDVMVLAERTLDVYRSVIED